jgi:hypothetical protein
MLAIPAATPICPVTKKLIIKVSMLPATRQVNAPVNDRSLLFPSIIHIKSFQVYLLLIVPYRVFVYV